MYEKVNPRHVDKIADRIAGAIVDLAYRKHKYPKIAVEVLIGHGRCNIIIETTVMGFTPDEFKEIVNRIAGTDIKVHTLLCPQDPHLAENQTDGIKCGDNGIFKGMPLTSEQKRLSEFARWLYKEYPYDGKFILNDNDIIICQSNAMKENLSYIASQLFSSAVINPLGYWTGGIDVDTGATNRKLGSDMGDAVTGGGLHGKDLSKADVSVNIYAHLKAQKLGKPVELHCAIGDTTIDGRPYEEIVNIARGYVNKVGGFEKLAEWGLI